MNFSKLLFRSWFYFRTGYNTYIAFFIGFASNVIVIYKLGISENKFLGPYFQSLTLFAILALAVLIPVSISAGLYHMKRTGAYAADASVSTESNPYIYKVLPGKEQEVFLPLWMMTVRGLARLLEQEKTMTADEKQELEDTLNKAKSLLQGQFVGHPRRRMIEKTV
ncbi:hypothetical protein AUH73_03965 [archaeon 13_1_40CM_4_53_4]|nr:MAG: hypothetical protein AUH73_03965 [archaeon 13_1_40CM_4_53_4]OLD03454.1 MAG: hypothetical protein AUJ07_06370 [Crenarchaeota archaeon 13_1_40CM_3_53_5]